MGLEQKRTFCIEGYKYNPVDSLKKGSRVLLYRSTKIAVYKASTNNVTDYSLKKKPSPTIPISLPYIEERSDQEINQCFEKSYGNIGICIHRVGIRSVV